MSKLVDDINSILDRLSTDFGADKTSIQEVEWKGEPQTFRFKKYEGTDWAPLYEAALAIDLAIVSAPFATRTQAEVESSYIASAVDYFLRHTKLHLDDSFPCSCGGTLQMKVNSKTSMGFYACNRWREGCKVTKNLFKQESLFSKRAESKTTGRRCPKCYKDLVVRVAKTGKNAGKEFVGCSGFPTCTHTEMV
jgi:ssDNA-binding Zn-finger/Zn-ribbon topoisomerase 1